MKEIELAMFALTISVFSLAFNIVVLLFVLIARKE